jgi:hypothetical protein
MHCLSLLLLLLLLLVPQDLWSFERCDRGGSTV